MHIPCKNKLNGEKSLSPSPTHASLPPTHICIPDDDSIILTFLTHWTHRAQSLFLALFPVETLKRAKLVRNHFAFSHFLPSWQQLMLSLSQFASYYLKYALHFFIHLLLCLLKSFNLLTLQLTDYITQKNGTCVFIWLC